MFDFNSSPIANVMKNSSGLWDFSLHGYWNLSGFISLKYMTTTIYHWSIDLQIQIAQIEVIEDIYQVIHCFISPYIIFSLIKLCNGKSAYVMQFNRLLNFYWLLSLYNLNRIAIGPGIFLGCPRCWHTMKDIGDQESCMQQAVIITDYSSVLWDIIWWLTC